jgi:hypothetical protein
MKGAVIKALADIAAEWIIKHGIMAAATAAWGAIELAWNAAVAGAKAAAATAWSLWGAVAIGAGMIAAIMAFQPHFAEGGIVPGTSYSGDNVIAAVNSGEMILNGQQQARLFEIANGDTNNVNNGQSINITINANGPANQEFAQQISEEIVQNISRNRKW